MCLTEIGAAVCAFGWKNPVSDMSETHPGNNVLCDTCIPIYYIWHSFVEPAILPTVGFSH